jgi:hypothetical protein
MICPGQNTAWWTKDDIFEIECPNCKTSIEFFKDDQTRKCSKCRHKFYNPKLDMGCAEYCKFVDKCTAVKFKLAMGDVKWSYCFSCGEKFLSKGSNHIVCSDKCDKEHTFKWTGRKA